MKKHWLNTGDDLLHDILFCPKCDHNSAESMELGGICFPLIILNNYETYIYGCGDNISTLILYMKQNNINVAGIIDKDLDKCKIKRQDGIPVLHISEVKKIQNPENVFVIINVHDFSGNTAWEITKTLNEWGGVNFYPISAYDYKFIDALITHRIEYFRTHYMELKRVYNSFEDEISKFTMLEFLRVTMQDACYSLEECEGKNKYFLGHSIDGEYEKLYKHKEDEVWLCCGANNGDTIFWFFAQGYSADIIVAVEADKKIYDVLCGNLERLPARCRETVKPVNICIDDKTDFTKIITNGKHISFINADIEGGELDLLKSLRNTIVKDRPVVAICAYHKPSDLIDFIDWFDSEVKDYSYKIRKYPTVWRDMRRSYQELVFYAIPKEREV